MSPRTKRSSGKTESELMNREQVRRLASLSRLTLTGPEEETLTGEFSSILGYFRVVDGVGDAIDTESPSVANVTRPDEVAPSDPEGVMKGVPRRRGRLVRAPRVF